jgi:hypothetical protein
MRQEHSQESGKALQPSRAPSLFVFHSFRFLLAPTLCLGFLLWCTPESFTGNLIVSENLGIIGNAALHPQAVTEYGRADLRMIFRAAGGFSPIPFAASGDPEYREKP